MTEDADILASIDLAFGDCERPAHFTNYTHCEECREHDELLRSRDRETLKLEDVNNPGWNPLCFISPVGFCYYLPAVVRLALMPPTSIGGWIFPELLFILAYGYEKNQHLRYCMTRQRQSIAAFLQHIDDTRGALVASYLCEDELKRAIPMWSTVNTYSHLKPAGGKTGSA